MENKSKQNGSKPLCILILQYNSSDLTIQLLESIVRHENKNLNRYRFIVMDNASEDPMQEEITRRFPFVEFVQYETNLGFASAHNRIMEEVHEDWVLLLNNDCILQNNAIEMLFEDAKERGAHFATCEVFNEDGTPQNNYSYLPSPLRRVFIGFTGIGRLMEPIRRKLQAVRVGYINGAVLLLQACVFRDVGFFDSRYFMYKEDFDLMLKLWSRGYSGWRLRGGRIVHLGGGSSIKRASDWELEQKFGAGGWFYWYKNYFPKSHIAFFLVFETMVTYVNRGRSDVWRARYTATRKTAKKITGQ